jgi:acyl-CoA dehydrogenase
MEALLTSSQLAVRDGARQFVRQEVSRQLVLDMDAGRVTYPRDFVEKLAARGLLGLRFPADYGGRNLGWADEVLALEEIGVLGTALACLYSLPSIVGEALAVFGTKEQKARWLRPIVEGRLLVAEALTEPRGGSDFFGTTTTATRDGQDFVLRGQKRFIVGAEGADLFLIYARTNPEAEPRRGISVFLVERTPQIAVGHVYGLMGTRGGGTGRVYFRQARTPAVNLIGELDGGAGCGSPLQRPAQSLRPEDTCL